MRLALAVSMLLVTHVASAQTLAERVAFTGVTSANVGPEELASVESAVEAALAREARSLSKEATIAALVAAPDVASSLAQARRAAADGGAALKTFDLPRAKTELDRALSLFEAAHGTLLVPTEVTRVLDQRAMLAYARGDAASVEAELARAVRVEPRRELDAERFPPDALAKWKELQASVRAAPLSAGEPGEMTRVARLAASQWIAAGEARVREGALDLLLVIAGADGSVFTRRATAPTRAALGPAIDDAVRELLVEAGVRKASPPAVAKNGKNGTTGKNGRTSTPPRTPLYRRWWVWAGAIAIASAGGFAAAEAATREDPSPAPTPRPGVTITFPAPP